MATANGSQANSARSGASGEWSPGSWRRFPVKQQAPFPDASALDSVRAKRKRRVLCRGFGGVAD